MNAPGSVPLPGFSDPVVASAATFRTILEVMSRPGRIMTVEGPPEAPQPMHRATAAAALTLFDHDTPVWLDTPLCNDAVEEFLSFHCGCPIVSRQGEAVFAVIARPGDLTDLKGFHPGTPEYPDRSATLILQVDALAEQPGAILSGPGIEDTHVLGTVPQLPDMWRLVGANNRGFPLGLDFIFASPDALAACPRSSVVELGGTT